MPPARRQGLANLENWERRGVQVVIPDSGFVSHPTNEDLDSSIGVYYLRSRNSIRTGRFVFYLFHRRRRVRRAFRLGIRTRLISRRYRQYSIVRVDTNIHSSIVNLARGTRDRVYQVPQNRIDLETIVTREVSLLREQFRRERRELELW